MFERSRLGALLIAGTLAVVPLSACADDSLLSERADDSPPPARADGPPVVLELFTSQGCSSCPSADAFLGEMAETRDDVIALSFHVDYWDYIGWEDPFATAETTARQKTYADTLGISYVYTPQLVIDGASHVTGSNRNAVSNAIIVSKASPARRVPVALEAGPTGRLKVEIGAVDGYYGSSTVWLVSVDRRHTTTVDAGENRGRSLTNHNVVRDYRSIGSWTGDAMTIELGPDDMPSAPEARGEGCAILVQGNYGKGRIIGADLVWLDGAEL